MKGYDNLDDSIKKSVSYYDLSICRLKTDLKKHYDLNSNINVLLFFESNKINLLESVETTKKELSEYLKNKNNINCSLTK